MKKHKNIVLGIVCIVIALLSGFGFYNENKDKTTKEVVSQAVNEIKDYITEYEMTSKEISELATSEIVEQTEEQEKEVSAEQEVESEAFELQGKIAYNGSNKYPNVKLGNYVGLTYYSQIDTRWKNHSYTSIGNKSQTIGSSGCGATCSAMVVTATKGTITPPEMGDLFVKYGFRSPNSGTYWSAFRWVADVFDIGYQETSSLDKAVTLLKDNNYVVCSVGNGLFTTGGHFILLTGVEDNNIKIYDPYLYSGKFDTSTRRGKVTVKGNTVYCSIDNFRKYANFKGFFAYKYETKKENKTTVKTSTYTRYVKVKSSLNVRKSASTKAKIVGSLKNNAKVTVYETKGDWARIGTNKWVSSQYLSTKKTETVKNTVGKTKTLKKNCTLYSKSSLSGTKYNYKKNTTVKILKNISSSVDYVQVKATKRKAYIKNNLYK